jgi:putative oxidoreductase
MKEFFLFGKAQNNSLLSSALLLLRVAVGILMMTHGWGKLSNFSAISESFPDPIGVGSQMSLMLAVVAEFFGSILLIFGFLTRLVVIPLAFTMAIAFFVIHAADPLQVKELALFYLIIYIFLFMSGPGEYSIDNVLSKYIGKK